MLTDNPKPRLQILVVDDEANVRRALAMSLEVEGFEVVAVGNAQDALAEAGRRAFDMAFVDLRLGTGSGMDLMSELIAQSPWMRVVVITAYGSIDIAVEAMKRGAADFLTKPFTPAQVRIVTDRVARLRAMQLQIDELKKSVDQSEPQAILDSTSPEMRTAVEMAGRVADSEATVLLRGESGTGKGVLARFIHARSRRVERAFTTVSCPSLSGQLLESELFGHVKGAFTGAMRDNPGRIAMSEGGTLFLDEIGDVPLEIQPKLLRFLQDRSYERVGDSLTRHADVRLICATNINLEEAVREKRFREDLFYRINVVMIELPPLRQRPDDIVPMAERMLAFFRGGQKAAGFTEDARLALKGYRWPGNVRELKNAVERAAILCKTELIGQEHLPGAVLPHQSAKTVELGDPVPFEKIEDAHIRRVLASAKSLEEAARALDIDVATLWRKRKKYNI